MRERAYLREVGPRDGIQLVKSFLPTEHKMEWIHSAVRAGFKEIEVTSFVPPSVIAQFSDADQIARDALKIPGLMPSVLVPNKRGAERAISIGCRDIGFVLSASEKHNLANVRRATDASIEDFKQIIALVRAQERPIRFSAAIATAFGCSIQGTVPEARVIEIAELFAEAGADEIMLADTVGFANPAQVKRLFHAAKRVVGNIPLRAHFHDTRGLGIANVSASLEAGVRHFDAALGGLGGCPFAPGATGNINAEDTVYLLESLGFETGINVDELLKLRKKLESWLPGETFFGMVARAGLPPTFGRHAANSSAA